MVTHILFSMYVNVFLWQIYAPKKRRKSRVEILSWFYQLTMAIINLWHLSVISPPKTFFWIFSNWKAIISMQTESFLLITILNWFFSMFISIHFYNICGSLKFQTRHNNRKWYNKTNNCKHQNTSNTKHCQTVQTYYSRSKARKVNRRY